MKPIKNSTVQATEIMSEPELIQSLKRRDESAFNHLYENYSSALYKIIYQIIPDEYTANDVLQKVFVNIWQKIEGYESSKGRLFTWMLNIARNASIDTIRSKAYQVHKKHDYMPDQQFMSLNSSNCYIRIDGIGISKYVAKLKPQQRMLIEMVYFRGYSHPEVAAMHDIPLSTIKTRVRTALTQLRTLLESEN